METAYYAQDSTPHNNDNNNDDNDDDGDYNDDNDDTRILVTPNGGAPHDCNKSVSHQKINSDIIISVRSVLFCMNGITMIMTLTMIVIINGDSDNTDGEDDDYDDENTHNSNRL